MRTDETEQAYKALEMTSEQLSQVIEDSHRWVWAIISLQMSLQGFMILALRNTNSLNVIRDDDAKKWMRAYDNHKPLPVVKLDYFPNLYKKIKSETILINVYSKVFYSRDSHDSSVKRLNELRNEFIHFVPSHLSLEISGLPRIFKDCLEIIKFLVFDSGNISWDDETLESNTRSLIDEISSIAVALEAKYSS